MKLINFVAPFMATMVMMCFLAGCSSDPNPIGYLNAKDAKTYVEINLNVASTRADEAATTEEKKISKVFLYIFNSAGELEGTPKELDVTSGSKVVVETTIGPKTIYAVTAKDVITTSSIAGNQITLANFESAVIKSGLSYLATPVETGSKTYSDFVMVGSVTTGNLVVSKSQLAIPEDNKFVINLERLVAKVVVNLATNDFTGFGVKNIDASVRFRVCQTANEMSLVSRNNEFPREYQDDNNDGTFDNYTFDNTSLDAAVDKNKFTLDNSNFFLYVPENIVDDPLSGNTTFIAVKFYMTVEKITSYVGSNSNYQYPNNPTFFYTLGAYDKTDDSFVDFVRDDSGSIIYFATENEISKYKSKYSLSDNYTYKSLFYKDASVWYRINIADVEGENLKYQVKRNKCYKITINSINQLGMPSVEDLVPSSASSPIRSNAPSASWVESSLNVTDWYGSESDFDL